MLVNLGLLEDAEFGLILGHAPNLDLTRFEVGRQDGRQAVDRHLDGLLVVQVEAALLQLLLQERIGLRCLGADGAGLECAVVPGGVGLVDHRASGLLVVGDQDHAAAERPHLGVLRVDLADVGDAPAEHVGRDVHAVLVFEIDGLGSSSGHLGSSVGDHAGHDAADIIRDLVHGRHGGGVEQLVGDFLHRCNCGRGLSSHSHRSLASSIDRLEGILDLESDICFVILIWILKQRRQRLPGKVGPRG